MSETGETAPEQSGAGEVPAAPTLERIDGSVPGAGTTRGRYVRFFAAVVVILFGIAVAWLAETLVSAVHHG